MTPRPETEKRSEERHTLSVYEVWANGRVYSHSNWRGYGSRELQQTPNEDGYASVRVYVNGVRKRIAVHVLVARKFLPPRPSPKHEIRHLDGNRNNPHMDNLRWGTRQDNADDRERHGHTSRGPKHSLAIRSSNHAERCREYRAAQVERSTS